VVTEHLQAQLNLISAFVAWRKLKRDDTA